MPVAFSADRPAAADFQRLARGHLEKAVRTARNLAMSPGERIHDVRKRSKKLRALFRLVRPDFPDFRQADAAVRDAARQLSAARDTRVLIDTLVELYNWAGRANQQPNVPEAKAADTEHEQSMLKRFAAAFKELLAASRHWVVKQIDADTLREGLRRTYGDAMRARARAERTGAAEDFHRWRRFTKYHWYQLNNFRECAPDVLPEQCKAAGQLADLLGKHHDLALLRERLGADPQALGLTLDVNFVDHAAAARQRELALLAARLADQIFAERPKAFARRVIAYTRHAGTAEPVAAAAQ